MSNFWGALHYSFGVCSCRNSELDAAIAAEPAVIPRDHVIGAAFRAMDFHNPTSSVVELGEEPDQGQRDRATGDEPADQRSGRHIVDVLTLQHVEACFHWNHILFPYVR